MRFVWRILSQTPVLPLLIRVQLRSALRASLREPPHIRTELKLQKEVYASNKWPAGLNAQDWLQYNIDYLFSGYLSLPDATWERCIRDDACDPQSITARQTQGALLLRMAQLHGPDLVKRWLRHLPELIESQQLSSAGMSAEDKADFLMESLSNAARSDLTCHFDSLNWPVSESLRSQLASNYDPSPYCRDQDQDDYSIFWGDCEDADASRHPGAPEVSNGIDDNCNGLVDDMEVTETGDFPSSRGTALPLAIPARISGEIASDGEGDYFRIELAEESTLRFTFQPSTEFRGRLLIFRQDFRGWEGGILYRGGGRPVMKTFSLGPGQWIFLIGFSSTPGPYELTIQPTSPPSHFTVAAPSQLQANVYQLFVPEIPATVSPSAGLVSRFWVSGVGWVGSSAVSGSQASLSWSAPSPLDVKNLRYRVQFMDSEQPVSYRSLPVLLEPRVRFLAQFGNGGGISSTVILVNPSSLQEASGEVRLFDADGQPLFVNINGTLQDGAFPFEVPPRGVGFFSTDGLGELATGSVSLFSYQPIGGTSLFSGSFGVAGVSANEPLAHFLVPIGAGDPAQSQTGLALSNPTGSEVQVVLRLRDGGTLLPDGEVSLALSPNGQFSGFPEQLFQGRGIDFSQFRGTLEVNAPVPINGMAILVTAGEFATLPVAPILLEAPDNMPDEEELHFAHIGNGDGITSTLVLMNPSAVQSATGRVHLFDSQGQPLGIAINGTVQAGNFGFELPPLGVGFYATDGLGDLVVGSAHLTSNTLVSGTLLFDGSLGVAGVPGVQPARRFLVPIESNAAQGVQTGVALSNPNDAEIEVTLLLREASGDLIGNAAATVSIAARGQFSGFPEQVFEGIAVDWENFRGALEVSSQELFNGMAVRVSPGQFATLGLVVLAGKAQ